MMKIVALLMALIAAASITPSLGQGNCFKHWTRAEAGTSSGQTYTGISNGTSTEDYNNPLWYSLADAQAGFTGPATKGRLSGSLPTATYVGPIKFDFFARRLLFFKNSLSITFTKSTGIGAITGGTGCYRGMSSGTATRLWIGNSTPRVFEWTFCGNRAPRCSPR